MDYYSLKIFFLLNQISEGEYRYIEQETLENNPSITNTNFSKKMFKNYITA